MPSLEYDDEDQSEAMPMTVAGSAVKPQFPYGMRICLTDKEFAKIGCNPDDLKAGDLIHLTECFARVTDKHTSDGEMGTSCRVELQIEHCNIEDETSEDE
jgi:hypothetical protein